MRSIVQGIASARESMALHRVRSVLTLLGVSIGVVGVLAIGAYGEFARAQVAARMARFGSNLVAVSPASPQTRAARTGKVNTLTTDDALAIAEQVPHVAASSAVKSGSLNAIAGRYSWNTRTVGVSAGFAEVHSLGLQSGAFFTPADDASTAAVAVLGTHVVERVFPGRPEPIGELLRLNGTDFRVMGVLAPRGQSVEGDLDDIVYVPLRTAFRRLYGGTNVVDRIEVRIDERANIGPAIATMTLVLERTHHMSLSRPDDFQIQNFQQVADRAASATDVVSAGLAVAAAIGLAIGGFGVMNIMLLSVSERTPEIGVRLAVGARGSDIRAQFLAEAVTLCQGGATIGACVGLVAAVGASPRLGVLVVPPVGAVLLATGISAIVGVLFGLYPAHRAAALDPIVALRSQ